MFFVCFTVHGAWSEWVPYSNCTGACHYGNNTIYRSRVRKCDNPAPDFGGNPCDGETMSQIPCHDLPPCIRKIFFRRLEN